MIDMYKKTVSEGRSDRLDSGFFICYILNTRNGSDKRNSTRENWGSAKPRDIKSLNNLTLYYRFKGQKRENINRVNKSCCLPGFCFKEPINVFQDKSQ